MAMLAEPKRKQRFTLNPRGKLWAEDANSFGQKLLKKMGWQNGKGLGANEDGKTEPPRITYKNDSKGMGYKETEQWTAHDDNFSSLLQNLNGYKEASEPIIKVNSLETKGENCRARINYHKFTKAKDISKYTEKDLANILGKKTLKQKSVNEEINEAAEKITEANSTLETKNDFLLNKGSMVDYFKKKLPNFSKRASEYVIGNNGVLTKERSDSESERPGFGFSQKTNYNENVGGEESIKKKKRKYAETFFSYSDKDTENLEQAENVQKKKSKRNESNSNFMHEDIISKNCEESFVSKKKNRKKEMVNNFVSYVSEGDNESVDKIKNKQDFECESILKQKKKKMKSKLLEDNLNKYNLQSENTQDRESCQGEINDISKEKQRKKYKHKDKGSVSKEVNGENAEEAINEDIVWCRLSKNKLNVNKLKDSQLDLAISKQYVKENSFESKKKKVKKNQNESEIQNDQLNCKEISCETIIAISDKKLKKHKRKKNEDDSITNVPFNESNEICNYNENNADHFDKPMHKNEKISSFKSYLKESNSASVTEDNTDYISKKKLKKKKSKNLDLDDHKKEKEDSTEEITKISNESILLDEDNKHANEDIKEYSIESEEVSKKSKKQKKSKKNRKEECDNFGITNPAFNDLNLSNANYSLQDDSKNEEINLSEDMPKKKKNKRKLEEVTNGGIDNPLFNEDVDNLNTTLSEESSNPYEIKVKRRKTSNKEANKLNDVGLDNPALNLSDSIPDSDLMLNVISTPTILKKADEKFDLKLSIERLKRPRGKSVRFSEVLQEWIIPNEPSERSNEYISNLNELFDINTIVVEDGIREEMKKQGLTYQETPRSFEINSQDPKEISKKVVESSVKEELSRGLNSCAFINNGFDIKSVDKLNFYETMYEVRSPNSKGIDNKAFNKKMNHIEENLESISNKIERYQAEVENNINEAKVNDDVREMNNDVVGDAKSRTNKKVKLRDYLVGDVGTKIDKNMKVAEGTKLCFNEMHFRSAVPAYIKDTIINSKKSYRHLIRGDITVAFKNANLHDIEGYAVENKE